MHNAMEFNRVANLQAFESGDEGLVYGAYQFALKGFNLCWRYPLFPTGESRMNLVDNVSPLQPMDKMSMINIHLSPPVQPMEW